ncbi:Gfo/Idh/MocA family protein [Methylobrevis pamukkalensis]|uniref:1,5-anhydro-D-fructose reductase n=1 Tax=Methylobrevis pamukkalensis TaxID=1439726 RepID=A0A1E3H0F8_9HYPH|nr:Gfo/Idh/MocA family oxidoreductase [Methylobrevis pamukkalensis]ODN69635.1 1,5-anhydro-D-fructose reductase [Methylobrevis pamukkalensis]
MTEITPQPVRIGVLSTAKIAREKVVPGLATTPWCVVHGISSRDTARARAVADDLGIPKAYGSTEEMLADPEIEAVYIPLPNDLHVDAALAAGRAGKHVLLEKPTGLDAMDAERLLEFPRDLVFMEGYMVRQHPQWRMVRDMVRAGRIGRPLGVQVWFSYMNDDPDNIRNRPETGGGAALDIGVYPLVVSRFVLDAEPIRLVAALDRDPIFATDRLTSVLADFGGGLHLTFTVSTQSVVHQRVTVCGTEGRIEVVVPFNAPLGGETILRFDPGTALGDASAETIVVPACNMYGLQGELFAMAIRGEAVLPYGVGDSITQMRLVDAIFESARRGGWVDL